MYHPNKFCIVHCNSGKTDAYGQPIPSGDKITERCAVVRLELSNEKSSVRADTSASRGAAREYQTPHAVVLLSPFTTAKVDDLVAIHGILLRVMSKEARFDIKGDLDHYQITGSYWGNA